MRGKGTYHQVKHAGLLQLLSIRNLKVDIEVCLLVVTGSRLQHEDSLNSELETSLQGIGERGVVDSLSILSGESDLNGAGQDSGIDALGKLLDLRSELLLALGDLEDLDKLGDGRHGDYGNLFGRL